MVAPKKECEGGKDYDAFAGSRKTPPAPGLVQSRLYLLALLPKARAGRGNDAASAAGSAGVSAI
jgi:hypothetical protein